MGKDDDKFARREQAKKDRDQAKKDKEKEKEKAIIAAKVDEINKAVVHRKNQRNAIDANVAKAREETAKLDEEAKALKASESTQTNSETFNPSPRASTVTSDQEKDQIAHAAENNKAIRRAIYNLHKVLFTTPYEPTEGRLIPEEILDLDGILCKLIPDGMRYSWENAYINETSKLNEEHILMLPEKTQLVIDMLDRKIKAEPTYYVILKAFYNQLVDAFNLFKKAVYPETHTITPKWETAHEKYTPTTTNMKEALQNIRDAHQESEPGPDSPRSGGG